MDFMANYDVPKDPESLGEGAGTLLADFLPLLPSGARRAGAAKVMAARIGDDPSFLVNHPIKTQLLAMGLGGAGAAFLKDKGKPAQIGAAIGPIATVQLLRHLELKRIQKNYDKKDRKRLRELDKETLLDDGGLGLGGSSRLGAVSAYEAMRDRKYKNFGSLAESADALQLAASAVHPMGGAAFVPVASMIDNAAADALQKDANDDFSDQKNSPSIPLYLAASALSTAGLAGARHWARSEDDNTPPLKPHNWSGMVGDISGTSPLLLGTRGVDNAFFYKPRSEFEAQKFLNDSESLADHSSPLGRIANSIMGRRQEKARQLLRHGAIIADSDASSSTIAHEAGHAKIEETPGILRALQRHVYPHSKWIAPMAGAGSLAAGLASGSTMKGALLGTGIGALANVGQIAPEIGASYHALKHLKGKGDGSLSTEGKKDLMAALSTYLAAAVLPSTLSGAAGGYISGRRKRNQ